MIGFNFHTSKPRINKTLQRPFQQYIYLTRRSFLFLCLASLLIGFMYFSFDYSVSPPRKTIVNHLEESSVEVSRCQRCTNSNTSKHLFDIVLSYYSENTEYVSRYVASLKNLSRLQALQPRFIVYNKNSKISNDYLMNILQVDIVQFLPNVGREGATYLYHIIKNYDNLANHILFSQAGVEGITENKLDDWYYDRLTHQFNSSVGFMPLVSNRLIDVYYCDSHRYGHFSRLIELWAMLEQTFCPKSGHAVAYRGQFLVSGRRIRNRSLNIYKYLYELITANSSHWIHRDIESIFYKSTPDNPIFGHVIERIWTVLFGCINPDLKNRCRQNQCACFDIPIKNASQE